MKKIIYILIAGLIVTLLGSCESIDYNYEEYMESVQKYSPRIKNLKATTDVGVINLKWDNPEGDLAVKIKIDAGGEYVVLSDEMISEYTFTDMPVKGYTISVYTIDKFGNLSVPQTINAFPGSNNYL